MIQMPHWLEDDFIGDPDSIVDTEEDTYSTLLTELAEQDDLEGINIALKKLKANPNIARPPDGITPLMIAVERKNKDIVEALLNAGADVNARDSEGETALGYDTTPEIRDMLEDAKAKTETRVAEEQGTRMAKRERRTAASNNVAGRRRKTKAKRVRRNKKTRRVARK